MAGNSAAQASLRKAEKDGATPEDVYESIAEQLLDLPRADRAFCLGYLARLTGREADKNPHEADGDEGDARLHDLWARGWEGGGNGDFEKLAAHAQSLLSRSEKSKERARKR